MIDDKDATAIRYSNFPVVPVEVTIAHTATGRKTRIVAQQCAVHATLWENLTPAQQDAANHVSICYEAAKPYTLRAMDYSRQIEPRGGEIPEEVRQLRKVEYFAWRDECTANGCDSQWAVEICGEGRSISSITRNTAKERMIGEHLRQSLDVMAKMKGWK